MAYIVLTSQAVDGEEIERVELSDQPVLIGRAQECDVAIADSLLSRQHCRIEQRGARWGVVDLQSRNGTHLHFSRVKQHHFNEGDHVRVGRTWITFYGGSYVSKGERPRPARPARPADPFEALSGTVTDFVFAPEDFVETGRGELTSASEEEKNKGLAADVALEDFDVCPSSPTQPGVIAVEGHSAHRTEPLDGSDGENFTPWDSLSGAGSDGGGSAVLVQPRSRAVRMSVPRPQPRDMTGSSGRAERRAQRPREAAWSLQARPVLMKEDLTVGEAILIARLRKAEQRARHATGVSVASMIVAAAAIVMQWLI